MAKGDKKPVDKKKNTKELEAEKLEQERLEREKKQEEDDKKFGIKELIKDKDYPMLLTQYYVETAWSHDSPRQFTKEYFMEALKRLKLDKLVSDDELELYSNFTLQNLIYGKSTLNLCWGKITVLVNLLFGIMINNDKRFQIEYPFIGRKKEEEEVDEVKEEVKGAVKKGAKVTKVVKDAKKGKKEEEVLMEPQEEQEEDEEFSRSDILVGDNLAAKTQESDLLEFKQRLRELMGADITLFEKGQIANIVEHAVDSYFNNFELFNLFQTTEQKEEELFIQVNIDEPYIVPPLESASYAGKIVTPEEQEQERQKREQDQIEEYRRAEQQRVENEEEARKHYEEWMGLDDATIKMIQEKLHDTKNYMMKRIEEKRVEYEEKLSNVKGGKKKK